MKKALLTKLMLLLCALIAGSSSVWATIQTNVSTVSTKFSTTGDVTNKITQTGTFTSATWNLAVTWKNNEGWLNLDGTKGSQIGSGNNPATSIVLTGSGFSGTISSVVVNTSGANSINATIGISVGSTAFQCNSQTTASITSSAADYTFTGSASGNIVITWTNSSDKAIYIKSVTITFDDGSSKTITSISFPQENYTINFGDAFTEPTLTCNSDGTVTYSSSNTAVAEVNSSTGALNIKKAGNVTITASVPATTNYTAGSASYNLIVKGAIVDGVFEFGNNQDYGSNAVPGTDANNTAETTWTAGKVSLAVAGRNIWYNGSDLRLYKTSGTKAAGNITLSVPSGYYMTRIDLTGGSNLELTNGGGVKNGTIWSGKSKSVKFTHNEGGTITLTKITVTYCTEAEFNTKVNITMGSDGYMTYCYQDAALSFGALEAYVVSAVGDDNVTLTPITKAPAGCAVVLKGAAGPYDLTKEDTPDAVASNRLRVSYGTTTSTSSYDVYALAKKGDVVGFYHVQAGVQVPAEKCYISVNKPTSAPDFLGFDFNGETTGINMVHGSEFKVNGEIYNLNGQRVAQPTKGLYIVNGKKVVIK